MSYRQRSARPPGCYDEQVRGEQRLTLRRTLAERYTNGEQVREIAEGLGRSYGFVHNLLAESGVIFRARGGAHVRKPKKTLPQAGLGFPRQAEPGTPQETAAALSDRTASG